jgi:LysR family glycine cleavage system transcriptional activator
MSLAMSNTYRVVCPKVNAKMAKIAAFREWLLTEAADDARRLAALGYAEVTARAV